MPIQSFVEQRAITHLIHFTRAENLPMIAQHGLVPLHLLGERGLAPIYNDEHRLDNTAATCMTISFPNYRYFYPLRIRNPDTRYVVLGISASVLWTYDCAFCNDNAASTAVSNIPLHIRRQPAALFEMFNDFQQIQRASLGIPSYFTTNPQAEVLVFDVIPPELITAVGYEDIRLKNQYEHLFPSREHMVGNKLFRGRIDSARWKQIG